MIREQSIEEIWDGRTYGPNDMVKADARGCTGCSSCCHGMGDSVLLDPLDVWRLSGFLGKNAGGLFEKEISLSVQERLILPHLSMEGAQEACVFLDETGRCRVHEARPGFCRLFPLGRYYRDGRFDYILQVHECPMDNRSKVKVRKWMDTPDLASYDAFVTKWHYLVLDLQDMLRDCKDIVHVKRINTFFLKYFFIMVFDKEKDFYLQAEERIERFRDRFLQKRTL